MTYTRNPNDPMVILANSANTLLQQYQTEEITLEQFKDAVNAQIVPAFNTLDTNSHNDSAMHTLSYTIAMLGAVE